MTLFHDRFENHAALKTLADLEASIESFDFETDDGEALAAHERFKRVVDYVRRAIKAADPELIAPNALDTIQKVLAKMQGAYQQFCQDKNVVHLLAPADEILPQLRIHLGYNGDITADQLPALLKDFEHQILEIIDRVRKSEAGSRAKLKEMEKEFEAFKRRIEQIEAEANTQQQQFSDLISKFQSQFTEAQNARAKEAREQTDQIAKDAKQWVKQTVDSAKAQLDKQIAENAQSNEAAIKELHERLAKAKELVELLGDTAVTGKFKKVADKHEKAADLFRWITVGLLAVMAILFVILIFSFNKDSFHWGVAVLKITATLAFAAGAWYTGHESTKHRKSENRNRRIELELASIHPYLDKLEPDTRKQIVKELAPRYFGREEQVNDQESLTKLKNLRFEDFLKIVDQVKKISENK